MLTGGQDSKGAGWRLASQGTGLLAKAGLWEPALPGFPEGLWTYPASQISAIGSVQPLLAAMVRSCWDRPQLETRKGGFWLAFTGLNETGALCSSRVCAHTATQLSPVHLLHAQARPVTQPHVVTPLTSASTVWSGQLGQCLSGPSPAPRTCGL